MKVGDVVPWPDDRPYDANAVRAAIKQRGKAAKANRPGASQNEREARAKKIRDEADEANARSASPYEQAKLFLGKLGYAVWDRKQVEGLSGFRVGRMVVEKRSDVLNYARKLGWNG